MVENPPTIPETPVQVLGQEDPLEKGSETHPCSWASLMGLGGEEIACNAGDLGSTPGLGRSPGEGKGYPPTPVFWPREFHGLCSSKGHKELDMAE